MISDRETEAQAASLRVRSRKSVIFFGRFGIRAGWGIAIFVVSILLVSVISGVFTGIVTNHLPEVVAARANLAAHGGEQNAQQLPLFPAMAASSAAIFFVGVLLTCWMMSKAEGRPLGAYGLATYGWKNIFPGAFFGVLAMASLVAVLQGMHLISFDGNALSGMEIPWWGLKWLFAFLLVGLAEEYGFRGYLQYTLARGLLGIAHRFSSTNARVIAFWLAAVILSALFTAGHMGNGNESAIGLSIVFLAGIMFTYALWRTGSLWWSVGMHTTWDWAQSFLFGVADSGRVSNGRLFVTHPVGDYILSGGLNGPEGSLFAGYALLGICVVIRFTTKIGRDPSLDGRSAIIGSI